jgi:signal transduction histidine kinase
MIRDVLAGAMVFAAVCGVCPAVLAQEAPAVVVVPSTRQDVEAFVQKAVAYAKENGKEASLKVFSDRNGPFVQGELYIYAYDMDGTVMGHGGQADLIGKNLIDMKDTQGLLVIQKLIELVNQGGGWLDYLWPNPLHGQAIEKKAGYVLPVDGTWFVGSGLYPVGETK